MTIEIREEDGNDLLTIEAIREGAYTMCMWHYSKGRGKKGKWACITISDDMHTQIKDAMDEIDIEREGTGEGDYGPHY